MCYSLHVYGPNSPTFPCVDRVPKSREFGSFLKGRSGSKVLGMMSKMGWKGRGLGKDEHGVVNPVEAKVRKEKAGISFFGDERTEQQKIIDRISFVIFSGFLS